MHRSVSMALTAALLVLVLVGGARADDRKEIDALYARLGKALKNRTPEATLALDEVTRRSSCV